MRNFFSESGTAADVEMTLVCERNTFNTTGVFTVGDHAAIGSGTTCGPYMLTTYPELYGASQPVLEAADVTSSGGGG